MKFTAQPNSYGSVSEFIEKDANIILDRTLHGKLIIVTGSNPITIFVPKGPELGFTCTIVQESPGLATIVPDAGVNVFTPDSNLELQQHTISRLFCYSGNELVLAKSGGGGSSGGGLGGAGIEGGVATAVIDTLLSTKQNLYTVPVDKAFILTKLIFRGATVSLAPLAINLGTTAVGYNAQADDIGQVPNELLAALTNPARAVVFPIHGVVEGYTSGDIGLSGETLGLAISDNSVASIVVVDVFGYLI